MVQEGSFGIKISMKFQVSILKNQEIRLLPEWLCSLILWSPQGVGAGIKETVTWGHHWVRKLMLPVSHAGGVQVSTGACRRYFKGACLQPFRNNYLQMLLERGHPCASIITPMTTRSWHPTTGHSGNGLCVVTLAKRTRRAMLIPTAIVEGNLFQSVHQGSPWSLV